jgi:hypothetical protein
MKTIPTLAVVALALGLVAAKSHSDSLHAPQVDAAAPLHRSVGVTAPRPDFFGSMLVVR